MNLAHRHFVIRDGRHHCTRCPWTSSGRTSSESIRQAQRHGYDLPAPEEDDE